MLFLNIRLILLDMIFGCKQSTKKKTKKKTRCLMGHKKYNSIRRRSYDAVCKYIKKYKSFIYVVFQYSHYITFYIQHRNNPQKTIQIWNIDLNLDKLNLMKERCELLLTNHMMFHFLLNSFIANPIKYKLLFIRHPQLIENSMHLLTDELISCNDNFLFDTNIYRQALCALVYKIFILLQSIPKRNYYHQLFNNAKIMQLFGLVFFALSSYIKYNKTHANTTEAFNVSERSWIYLYTYTVKCIMDTGECASWNSGQNSQGNIMDLVTAQYEICIGGKYKFTYNRQYYAQNTINVLYNYVKFFEQYRISHIQSKILYAKIFKRQYISCGYSKCTNKYVQRRYNKLYSFSNKSDFEHKVFANQVSNDIIINRNSNNNLNGFKCCKRCGMIYYCSRKCQKLSWKKDRDNHKWSCDFWSAFFKLYF